MRGSVGCLFHWEGKQVIKRPRENADPDTEKGGQSHCEQHIKRCLLAANPGVVGKKNKKRNLDPGVVKHTRRGKEQDQPCQDM